MVIINRQKGKNLQTHENYKKRTNQKLCNVQNKIINLKIFTGWTYQLTGDSGENVGELKDKSNGKRREKLLNKCEQNLVVQYQTDQNICYWSP